MNKMLDFVKDLDIRLDNSPSHWELEDITVLKATDWIGNVDCEGW